jgi:hypothetical protein
VKALADYTTALATLAANKPAVQMQTDATKANSSLKTLTTDATSAFDSPAKGAKAPDFASPVSDAVTAMSDVLKLIEDHRAASAIRASIEKNDAKITPLYRAMEKESKDLFARQTDTTTLYGERLFLRYEQARIAAHPSELIPIGERIKQYEKDSVALPASDPTSAINAFEKSHVALVNLIIAKPADKKASLTTLIAEIKSFEAELKSPSTTSASAQTTQAKPN